MDKERNYDVAHLGHVELLTPKLDENLRFFRDVLGLTESGRKGDSIYLRGWDDYERATLKLTDSPAAGLGHMGFRARSQQALDRRVAALKGSGFEIGWTDGDLGHGSAYLVQDPDGHKIELYYETDEYMAPPGPSSRTEEPAAAIPRPRHQRPPARSGRMLRAGRQGQP